MQSSEHRSDRITWFLRLATFILVVAVLRLAEDVLLPIAFSVLLAFLLSPLVIRLMRWGLPRALAIIVTVTVAFGVIGGITWLVTAQTISLVRELPNYEDNIRQKIATIKNPHAPAFVERMSGMVDNLSKEIQRPTPKTLNANETTVTSDPAEVKPVPVEIKGTTTSSWEMARDIVSPALRPLGTAGIVIVFVVAILFQREDLRDRFIKLVSAGKLNRATQAVDDAAGRVSRYLGMQLIVNATYGVPIGVGLYFIGIPSAMLWGLLATLLRFIPFVGPWIAAAFPLVIAIAVDPGWSKLFYTLGLFVVMELISNNIIEVVLYGASTGISNFALLVAAVFWTWLWGAAGLVLSTPMTVCVLVLGNHVPGMSFLSMLLGSEPVLELPAQFYQRMLSMESEDMIDLATKHVEETSLDDFYEKVFVPALLLSEEDRHSGTLSEARQQFIFQSSRELIDELERRDTTIEGLAGAEAPAVVGIPARDTADEVVASMLRHLLHRRGIQAAVAPLTAPLEDTFKSARAAGMRLTFISALPPSAVGAARQMCRRLKVNYPDTRVLVGVWQHRASVDELERRLHGTGPDEIVTTLESAVDQIEVMLGRKPHSTRPPMPTPEEAPPPSIHERPGMDDGSHPPFQPGTRPPMEKKPDKA